MVGSITWGINWRGLQQRLDVVDQPVIYLLHCCSTMANLSHAESRQNGKMVDTQTKKIQDQGCLVLCVCVWNAALLCHLKKANQKERNDVAMLEGDCCELSPWLKLVLWGRCVYVPSLSSERNYKALGRGRVVLNGG